MRSFFSCCTSSSTTSHLQQSSFLITMTNLVFLTLLLPFYTAHSHSLPDVDGAKHDNGANSKQMRESVEISIKAILVSSNTERTLLLRSEEDLAEFQRTQRLIKDQIEVTITRKYSNDVVLYLEKNSLVITKDFVTKFYTGSGQPVVKAADENDAMLANCYYTGKVIDYHDSLASVSSCHGINGIVEYGDKAYRLEPVFVGNLVEHILIDESHIASENVKYDCGTTASDERHLRHESHHKYNRRDKSSPHQRVARDIRLPAGHSSKTRYIEVYAVMDHSIYIRSGSVDAAVVRAINIINYASALYKMLDIYLALVGVEVWNDRNKIAYTNSGADSIDPGLLLKEFNEYRHFHINWNVTNDSGQLFSAEKFKDGLIGKGSTTAICTQTDSGGVTFDGDESRYARAATTMSHELGHNLAMIHSNSDSYLGKDCSCDHPGDPNFTDCIMHSSAGPYKQSRRWSKCTKEKLDQDFKEGNLDSCLKNKPETLQMVGNTPVCGNFFVEEGEECDCGHPADCQSKCCNPTTCKLYTNATCATGSCCDLDTCTVRSRSYPCRLAHDSQCDLDENCDGESEYCPTDTHKHDGVACNNHSPGHCYAGRCDTHASQCKFVWGDTADNSNAICYEQFNNRSTYYGNCGWSSRTDNFGESTVKKIYHSCQKESDQQCGLLQCQYDKNVDTERRIKNFPLILYPHYYGKDMCAVSSFDVGYKSYDPGQVPNGAKCGDNSMCVDSKCVSVPETPDHCDCNGRGTCNQFKECHCDIGWAPPFCKGPGMGGSITSNPPVIPGKKLSIIVGLVTFFCGIVPMVLVVGFVAYRRRERIKDIFCSFSSRFSSGSPGKSSKDMKVAVVADRGSPSHAVDNRTYNIGQPAASKKWSPKSDNKSAVANTRSIFEKPTDNDDRKAAISAPVFQSSTTNQLKESVKLKPSRTAPPRPNIPLHSQTSYENCTPNQASTPANQPPLKPQTPAKPTTPARPAVALKPTVQAKPTPPSKPAVGPLMPPNYKRY